MHDRAHPEANLMNIHTIDISLDRLALLEGERLFKGVPRSHVPVSPWSFSDTPVPLVVFRSRSCAPLDLTDAQLTDLRAVVLRRHPSFRPEHLQRGNIVFHLKGVCVRSTLSGKSELRATFVSESKRVHYTKTTNLYSYCADNDNEPRKLVACVEFFLTLQIEGAPAHFAYARLHTAKWDKGPVPYFKKTEFTREFIACERFGGLIGWGRKSEPGEDDLSYIFPREDTLFHTYS